MRTYIPPQATQIPDRAELVFDGVIFKTYQWQQEMFDGTDQVFEMIKRPDSVDIIAVTEDKILLNKESQPHAGSFIALPAGMHDHEEEDELEAAKRELKEETGYTFSDWKLIYARTSSKKIDHITYTFLATNAVASEKQDLDIAGERIETIKVTLDELKKMRTNSSMRFYPDHIFAYVDSLEDLLSLPSLHEYK